MGQELTLRRVGRFLQGAVVTVWALDHLELSWDMWKALLLFHTVLGGACFFFGLFVLQGTVTFWTTETLEIMNTVTYGGVETSQYPISIYRPWFQRFFIMVIPMACVTYFPILSILDRPDPLGTPVWFQTVAPAIGFAFLVVSLRIWRIGVRHYQSTGS
jgi:ABC-2 type transport system permease protein